MYAARSNAALVRPCSVPGRVNVGVTEAGNCWGRCVDHRFPLYGAIIAPFHAEAAMG